MSTAFKVQTMAIEISINECILIMSLTVKPCPKYIAQDASRPEIIIFSMGCDRRDAGIKSSFIPASQRVTNPIEKIMTSGRDSPCTVYYEQGFKFVYLGDGCFPVE